MDISNYFTVTNRGIRQGCPLSVLLFIIAAEMLARKIHYNNNIKGIHYDGNTNEIKTAQFADDMTIFVENKKSSDSVLQEVDNFTNVAGLELNLIKWKGCG